MPKPKTFEDYPCWIVAVSGLFSLLGYAVGAYIMLQLGLIWLILYLAFIIYLEVRLMAGHCVDCYYYGKTCAFGKGRLSALLFRKGDPKRYAAKAITWRDIIPDFLVMLIPAIVGIVLIMISFSWLKLSLILLLILLTTMGNGFVRSNLACPHCRQRKLGCPAEKMFSRRK